VTLAMLVLAAGVRAQDPASVPARPQLDNGADTNSAQNYFNLGMKMVYEKPAEAAHAFYWASRIDPSSGDAMYALRAATLLAMPRDTLLDYLDNGHGKKRKKGEAAPKRRPDQLVLDSLEYRAFAINPFVYANLDPTLMRHIVQAEVLSRYPRMSAAQVDFGIMQVMQTRSNQAWLAYAGGRFPEALAMYAKVLTDSAPHVKKRDSTAVAHYREFLASEVHAQRARIFYLLDDMDSARFEMSAALETMRERDSADMVILYQSKAMFQQSLGMIYERLQRIDLAREAYGQALQEDLSYYAAHSRLAQMTLAKGDTAGALSEMDLAVQLQPDDPVLRFRYADVLVHARRDGDAAVQLRKAIAIDPYYGAPHLLFARIADVEHYTDDAVSEYKSYIVVAARTDKQLLVARARLAELTSTVASTPAKP
jgi:tetratricopeptide (TPR) repeat protein